ncbi:F-box protein PP2-B3-like [Euphorbia lathyris]|uniref:F-box protein PP2-B3-like n=1 Tax=Euphorbia lathyris TaxID=212925 RepID=UPI0033133664
MSTLPKGCIANILSFTNLKTICVLSKISSAFKNAAKSDTVWEKFLPSDHHFILSLPSLLSKKQLFLNLCNNPILIDNRRKSFSLAKWSGKKCFMLSAIDLQIVWGDYSPHWKWTFDPNSRLDFNLISKIMLDERAYGFNSPVASILGFSEEQLSRNTRNVYFDERIGFKRRTMNGDMESLVFVACRDIFHR